MAFLIVLMMILATGRHVDCGKNCAIYDGESVVDDARPHVMASLEQDVKPGTILPGSLRAENLRPVRLRLRTCPVEMKLDGNVVRFVAAEELRREGCAFQVELDPEEGCPETTPTAISVAYVTPDRSTRQSSVSATFDRDIYNLKMTFPVPPGTVLTGDIVLVGLGFPDVDVRLEPTELGVELVPITSRRFALRATTLLYVQDVEDVNVAAYSGERTLSQATVRLHADENSLPPRPEFEKAFYNVTLRGSELEFGRVVSSVRLAGDYARVGVSVRPFPESYGFRFEADPPDEGRVVRLRVAQLPPREVFVPCILLRVSARVIDSFRRKSEGFTSVHVALVSDRNDSCNAIIYESDNKEHLTIAVIVLSVAVVLMFFLLIYCYFKYVSVKKRPEPRPPPVCHRCSNVKPVRDRRPTPRRISEFPYPLDILPPPLETLAETEIEEEVESVPVKIMQAPEAAKTRKRSLTFLEKDDESRLNREEESELESDGDGRRRRKSSSSSLTTRVYIGSR